MSFFFDNLDEGTGAWSPGDFLFKRETLEFVRAYYRIEDPAVRRRLFKLTEAIPAKKPSLRDDPHVIAEYLVQEHGLERALDEAIGGTTAAQEQGDNYGLSVWREVKRILREWGRGG